MAFDPYHQWLGISKDKRPPTHYQVLGLSPDEKSATVIRSAAARQKGYVLKFQEGLRRDLADLVLGEIADAEIVLLDPDRRRDYDAKIHLLHHQQKSNWERSNARKYRVAGKTVSPAIAYMWTPFRAFFSLFELHTEPEERTSGSVFTLPVGLIAVLAMGLCLIAASLWLPWRKFTADVPNEILPANAVAVLQIHVDPPESMITLEGTKASISGTDAKRRIEAHPTEGSTSLTLTATLDGFEPFENTYHLKPGESRDVTVRLHRRGDIPDFFVEDKSVVSDPPTASTSRENQPIPPFFEDDMSTKSDGDESVPDFFRDDNEFDENITRPVPDTVSPDESKPNPTPKTGQSSSDEFFKDE